MKGEGGWIAKQSRQQLKTGQEASLSCKAGCRSQAPLPAGPRAGSCLLACRQPGGKAWVFKSTSGQPRHEVALKNCDPGPACDLGTANWLTPFPPFARTHSPRTHSPPPLGRPPS